MLKAVSDYNFAEGEVLLINKPYTWTSFQVVNKLKYVIKHSVGTRHALSLQGGSISKNIKIGHAGTLDPLATGLLIVCTGKFTKRIQEFQDAEKEYTGSFMLGATTPCCDMEKPVDKHFPTEHITEEQIRETAKSFLGAQMQVPPIFSAVKIDGRRAYKYARQNEEVEIQAKPITISEFEIKAIRFPEVDFRIVCSKGTYIRSIARDFGERLQSGAYLSALCRTRIGAFKLEDATELDDFVKHLS